MHYHNTMTRSRKKKSRKKPFFTWAGRNRFVLLSSVILFVLGWSLIPTPEFLALSESPRPVWPIFVAIGLLAVLPRLLPHVFLDPPE